MKKGLKIILLILAIVFSIACIIYEVNFDSEARQGKENISNLQKINIGMSEYEVTLIMGQPDNISIQSEGKSYKYISNVESYAYISFIFDSNMKVIKIYPSNKFNYGN